MPHFRRFLTLALALSPFSSAMAASVLHLQGRAFSQDATASAPLARDTELPGDSHLVVDAGAQVQIQISEGSFLEIHGPARATLAQKSLWTLESGRFLIFSRDSSPHRFQIMGETIRPDEAAIEIQIPNNRDYAQVLLLWGSQRILGENLDSEHLYLIEKGRLQKSSMPAAESLKRRQAYAFSENLFRRIDDSQNSLSLRNHIAFSPLVALNRENFVDKSPSNKSVGFGFRAEWVHKRYLKFPQRPQRIHFLRSPALRLGIGGTSLSSPGGSQNFGTHGLIGASWLALSVDTLVTYLVMNSAEPTPSPLKYGVRAQYEWDLKEFTANDMMIALGYGYAVSNTEDAAISREVEQSVNLAFIFNF